MHDYKQQAGFIWSIAELLRGDYKRHDNGKVILPLTVLRRLECVLEPTRAAVRAKAEALKTSAHKEDAQAKILAKVAGHDFYNTSALYFALPRLDNEGNKIPGSLLDDPDKIAENLTFYIKSFSPNARAILDHFKFEEQIATLDKADLLFMVMKRFCTIDLHPKKVPNHAMGTIFEELIRRFSEQSNETAGEHFTPREVIRLMVNLLFTEDRAILTRKGVTRKLYDPACGTGGMLSVAEEFLRDLNPEARLIVFGQELNPEAYAICNSDMLIKGQDTSRIIFGNTFNADGLKAERFDYMLSNPPFGVEWKKVEREVRDEHAAGSEGRFGPGLPRISDGSLLFLLHMVSKLQPVTDETPDGGRIAVVFNGSPLFTGDAGSGESEIRKYIIKNDLLEAIVALPDQLFFNTGIFTYVWVVTNRKAPSRTGRVQLVNGVSFFEKMAKSLGNKRNFISDAQIAELTRLYAGCAEGPHVKVFDNDEFGYHQITVERPLRLTFSRSGSAAKDFAEHKEWVKWAKKRKVEAEGILARLQKLPAGQQWTSRPAFEAALAKVGIVDPQTPVWMALVAAYGTKDPKAEPYYEVVMGEQVLVPDSDLRDRESVPLKEDIHAWFAREVLPYRDDAWIDEERTRVGYEIPFTRHFYVYTPLPPLEEIDAEIQAMEGEILAMLKAVMA